MVLEFVVNHWGLLVMFAAAVVLLYFSVVVVGGNEIALIERRWFGSPRLQR